MEAIYLSSGTFVTHLVQKRFLLVFLQPILTLRLLHTGLRLRMLVNQNGSRKRSICLASMQEQMFILTLSIHQITCIICMLMMSAVEAAPTFPIAELSASELNFGAVNVTASSTLTLQFQTLVQSLWVPCQVIIQSLPSTSMIFLLPLEGVRHCDCNIYSR